MWPCLNEFFYPNSFDSLKDLLYNLGNFLFEYNHLRRHQEGKMRIFAGILMIFGTIMSIPVFGSLPGEPGASLAFPLIFVYMGLTLSGGIFALKGKHWKLCLTASILLFLLLIYSFFYLSLISTFFAFPGGILPITLVYFGKREWKS